MKLPEYRRIDMKKIIVLSILILVILSSTCFAATPKLITSLENNLETIKDWIIRLATPAAAVAIRCRNYDEKI